MTLEELIPDDWSPEQAETIADGLYEIADAIMTVHGLAIRQLWRERDQLRDRGPDLG
ncbi:MAG: hypothetical protein KKA99_06825 [Gammaproteobacteria bacterium]|nr:hypothetical protein [Gammaproteobacteria bacterium]